MKRTGLHDSDQDETDDNNGSDNNSMDGVNVGQDHHQQADQGSRHDETAGETTKSSAASLDELKQRARELNRMSKIRCRQRKKDRVKDLETHIARLSAENRSLQTENDQLRQEFTECYSSLQQAPPQRPVNPIIGVPSMFQFQQQHSSPVSASAQPQFPSSFNIPPPVWDNNLLAWLGAQALGPPQQASHQGLLSCGVQAPPQDNQQFDPRLIPLVASLRSDMHRQRGIQENGIFFNTQSPSVTQRSEIPNIAQNSEYIPALLATNMFDWIRDNVPHQATPSQQETSPRRNHDRHYDASSEHSSDESASKFTTVWSREWDWIA